MKKLSARNGWVCMKHPLSTHERQLLPLTPFSHTARSFLRPLKIQQRKKIDQCPKKVDGPEALMNRNEEWWWSFIMREEKAGREERERERENERGRWTHGSTRGYTVPHLESLEQVRESPPSDDTFTWTTKWKHKNEENDDKRKLTCRTSTRSAKSMAKIMKNQRSRANKNWGEIKRIRQVMRRGMRE